MPSEQLQVNFRMPASLKARLERAAQAAGRTLTAEIVSVLTAAVDGINLPESIVHRLRDEARRNKRPLSTELLHRVIESFAEQDRPQGDELRDLLRVERDAAAKLRQQLTDLQTRPDAERERLMTEIRMLRQELAAKEAARRESEIATKLLGDRLDHVATQLDALREAVQRGFQGQAASIPTWDHGLNPADEPPKAPKRRAK